jgi:iron complex transport system substrate-binding protein
VHCFKKVLITITIAVFAFSFYLPAKASSYYFTFDASSLIFTDTFGTHYELPHKPIFVKGKYLIPLRAVVEDAGGIVLYENSSKTIFVRYGDNTGTVVLGKNTGFLSNSVYKFEATPFVIKGRTMISAEFIAELFGGSLNVYNKQCKITFYRVFSGKDALDSKVDLCFEPKRIISLAPNLTEILFAIGAGDKVVGVSNYSDFPDEAKKKQKVGGFFNPSIEEMFVLDPDIVLVARGTPLSVINKLKSLGLAVYSSDPHSIKDIYNLIITVGKITGNITESLELVNSMKNEEKLIKAKTDSIPHGNRKKVYVEMWNNPKISVGKDTFINSLITEAGGINIAVKVKGNWPVMSDESVIQANPDVIILLYPGNINEIKKRPGWENLNAVKNNRIYVENPDIFERPGPRIIQALKLLFNILYGQDAK